MKKLLELNKLQKVQKNRKDKIKTIKKMIELAGKIIKNKEIKDNDKLYEFVFMFSKGNIIW